MIANVVRKAAGLALAATLFSSAALADTKDAILESHKVTIGIHNRQPWGFRAEDGSAAGFHPDLIRAAFQRLGVKPVDFVITEFGALIPGLNAGRFDMVASGLPLTPPPFKVVNFREPHPAVGHHMIGTN